MCGINGFTWPDRPLITAMNEATRHRGPDDSGVSVDASVSLGHTRLSIIDLSADGRQPMANEDGAVRIVFNGEIYNYRSLRDDLAAAGHRFTSRTDTEVIVHAYETHGPACLDLFQGMWAFAIHDTRNRTLFLARDRFGIKPLYYHLENGRLIFSSMISGILVHGVRTIPNDRAIMRYMAYNLLQDGAPTFFQGIASLEPGHCLTFSLDTGEARMERWYSPRKRPAPDAGELKHLFTESVRAHTVSDVPVGVCLSGGVDSTAITMVLNSFAGDSFSTFSLEAPGSAQDERRYIEEVGRLTRSTQYYTQVTPDDFFAELDDFVTAMEEPVTGLSAYAQYRVFKLAREHGAKVLLDGQGGDELFAGYLYYFGYHFSELLHKGRIAGLAREAWACWRRTGRLYPHAMLLFLLLPGRVRQETWKRFVNRVVDAGYLAEILGKEADPRWRAQSVRASLDQTLFSTSIPHNLMWEDKSSMRFGVESRVPFLDVHLVEAAMALPPHDLLGRGETKRALRAALSGVLPPMIRDRKDKIGFAAPVDAFFRTPRVAALAREVFTSRRFASRPYWNQDKATRLLEAHIQGRASAGDTLWKCLNVELWLRAFFEEKSFLTQNGTPVSQRA